ncbi:hypothetical protein BpHYR1_032340 [Brachionus plicatilis]|uniref:RNA-directed DNA polymerase from mobile element jockey-like n=1 Tax=Brachionus plicatilis TaxID=10195 RepID=A0A3M7QB98_BRAPC|nr:hypothetical protein BpHYR1_032340 [Brachionus plicatilis]
MYKIINCLENVNLHQRPMLRNSIGIDGPAASTRGHSKRIRALQRRELNDHYASVNSRMNLFSNRVAGMWNSFPNNVAQSDKYFKL